ncbi:MAG TPA: hypothetical protein VMJ65_17260 [Solirubrobacteraceae bacterium]|nr:hypothetical protein [Solirubrobacteraceae bacterium]
MFVGSPFFTSAAYLQYTEAVNAERALGRPKHPGRWRRSIAFGASAIAALLEPSSGEPVSARIAHVGMPAGEVCFLIGAQLLMPEAASEQRAAEAGQSDDSLARASSQTP